jgi:hypothetical protein
MLGLNNIKSTNYYTFSILIGLSIIGYYLFAYQTIRSSYFEVFSLYTGLFILFWGIYTFQKNNFTLLAIIAILFRLIFIVAIPNLSQDFYRFIWDGRMILKGFNPYLYTPESFISKGIYPVAEAKQLYQGMGQLNGSHFTNYPPINQLSFIISNIFSNNILGSVVVMRLQLILADIGILYFGKKLLERLKLPISSIFLYLLNPFIIIELTGNLHFESLMLFFLVWSIYLLHTDKWKWAAVLLALSISVKLIPLLFLPLFYQRFKIKNLIVFYSIIMGVTILLFVPFLNQVFINNYAQTIGLWFQNFEFNASIYYVVRAIGFKISGYNQIAIIGKVIPIMVILIVLGITFFRRNITINEIISAMLLSLTSYFFLSTTVHPWYIATIVLLGVFTSYKYAQIWSWAVILSYSAYATSIYSENLWLIGIEYIIVFTWFGWEVFFKKSLTKDSKGDHHLTQND